MSLFNALATGGVDRDAPRTIDVATRSDVFVSDRIQPNTRTYNIVLKGLRGAHQSDLDRCFGVLQLMARNHVVPDTVTMNTMMDACVKAGNLSAAEQVWSLLALYS